VKESPSLSAIPYCAGLSLRLKPHPLAKRLREKARAGKLQDVSIDVLDAPIDGTLKLPPAR
jgi:hypothetical protein